MRTRLRHSECDSDEAADEMGQGHGNEIVGRDEDSPASEQFERDLTGEGRQGSDGEESPAGSAGSKGLAQERDRRQREQGRVDATEAAVRAELGLAGV